MVEHRLPKPNTRVRFPQGAPRFTKSRPLVAEFSFFVREVALLQAIQKILFSFFSFDSLKGIETRKSPSDVREDVVKRSKKAVKLAPILRAFVCNVPAY